MSALRFPSTSGETGTTASQANSTHSFCFENQPDPDEIFAGAIDVVRQLNPLIKPYALVGRVKIEMT
jgi:hypothetical protein